MGGRTSGAGERRRAGARPAGLRGRRRRSGGSQSVLHFPGEAPGQLGGVISITVETN